VRNNVVPPNGFGSDDSLLVVAPHPDDESISCGGILQRARAAGAKVAIVWVTDGDAFELDAAIIERRPIPGKKGMESLGRLRRVESLKAAAILGVPRSRCLSLGYPDGGLRSMMVDHYESPYISNHTGYSFVHAPDSFALGSAYEGRNLLRDLGAIIDRVKPTLVLAPTPLDEHSDHAVVAQVTIDLMAARQALSQIKHWIVHVDGGWPRPRGLDKSRTLTPPKCASMLRWEELRLSDWEIEVKLKAICAHRSQVAVMRPFLYAFVGCNELFASKSYSY
jgi:LmbE family N-acetylglucosaminyl deacetylase